MGNLLNLTVWFVSVGMLSLISTENVVASSSLEGLAGNSEGATECGIQMFVPKMLNIYGQPLRLESYRYTHLFAHFLSRASEPLAARASGLRTASGASIAPVTQPS